MKFRLGMLVKSIEIMIFLDFAGDSLVAAVGSGFLDGPDGVHVTGVKCLSLTGWPVDGKFQGLLVGQQSEVQPRQVS